MNGSPSHAGVPDLSVIIVNRNTCELLRACLRSIPAGCRAAAVEVIVVDNGSTDGSVEMLEGEFPSCRLIRNATNTGFAYPNNQGLALSRGRYILLLNSDTEVQPGSLDRLVSFMDGQSDAGACGPRLIYPDGSLQPSCRSFPTLWRHLCDMLFLDRLFPRSRVFGNMETYFDHNHTARVDQPMGAALLVRREALDQVGPLDERFKIYYNDVDWCYRLHRAGWQIYFVHDAIVVHHQGVTTSQENRGLGLGVEMTRNVFDYYEKHFGRAGRRRFQRLLLLGFALRNVIFSVLARVAPAESVTEHLRYVRGTLRAARTGDPEAFARE